MTRRGRLYQHDDSAVPVARELRGSSSVEEVQSRAHVEDGRMTAADYRKINR